MVGELASSEKLRCEQLHKTVDIGQMPLHTNTLAGASEKIKDASTLSVIIKAFIKVTSIEQSNCALQTCPMGKLTRIEDTPRPTG